MYLLDLGTGAMSGSVLLHEKSYPDLGEVLMHEKFEHVALLYLYTLGFAGRAIPCVQRSVSMHTKSYRGHSYPTLSLHVKSYPTEWSETCPCLQTLTLGHPYTPLYFEVHVNSYLLSRHAAGACQGGIKQVLSCGQHSFRGCRCSKCLSDPKGWMQKEKWEAYKQPVPGCFS
eukprot:scaffold63766_cov21-Tisochrysis_lutea.AAC.4